MNFDLSPEDRTLMERLDVFCDKYLYEENIQKWLVDGGVPDEFMSAYFQEGFAQIGLPEKLGGVPASILTEVLMLELIGRRAGAVLPVQSKQGVLTFAGLASEEQLELVKGSIAQTGKCGLSFAVSEPQSGSATFAVDTTVVEEDDYFVMNGAKSFVSSGQYAPYTLVLAHDKALDDAYTGKGRPLTFFLVPLALQGVDTIPVEKIGWRLSPSAEIIFNDVRLRKESVVGSRGEAGVAMLNGFERGRTYTAATTIGMAEAALDEAAFFCCKHKINGKPMIELQAIQELLTDMQVKVDAMRALLYKTACDLDLSSQDSRVNTAVLKRYAPLAATEVADSAMQILGRQGFVKTSKVARIWAECRGSRLAEGTDQIMSIVAGKRIAARAERERLNRPAWRF